MGESVITSDILFEHTSVLASPEFEGRFPGTIGERKTIQYLTNQFSNIPGVVPGNGPSYTQQVPLLEGKITSVTDAIVSSPSVSVTLQNNKDVSLFTWALKNEIDILQSDIVFVGYGANSPENSWNDYQNIDVRGKTVICLVNDPGFHSGDKNFFKGRSMTYYGRWTYKYKEAALQGASAVLIVHNTEAAGYGWDVVNTGKENYFRLDDDEHTVPCKGWITEPAVRKLFNLVGLNFDDVYKIAHTRNFKSFYLPLKFSVSLKQTVKKMVSDNFLALLPGSTHPHEYIIYSAHYDHFGIKSNGILAGARDNALGVSSCIALAKAFSTIPYSQRARSVLFLIPTAEEQGLLGSFYYISKPVKPLENTIACINMDVMNIFGKTKDISFYGRGNSDLDELADVAAKLQNRVVTEDPCPENGMFYRSDHFPFALAGVPGLFINMGFDHVEKGSLKEINYKWTLHCYHKPTDVVVRDENSEWCWDLSGAVEDVRLIFKVGCELVLKKNKLLYPDWKKGCEFKRTTKKSKL